MGFWGHGWENSCRQRESFSSCLVRRTQTVLLESHTFQNTGDGVLMSETTFSVSPEFAKRLSKMCAALSLSSSQSILLYFVGLKKDGCGIEARPFGQNFLRGLRFSQTLPSWLCPSFETGGLTGWQRLDGAISAFCDLDLSPRMTSQWRSLQHRQGRLIRSQKIK